MSTIPTPQLPLYRVTLFYGPEAMPENPPRVSCVFNVKKRSWKGGVQVAVEVDDAQVAAIKRQIGFDEWLEERLRALTPSEREDYQIRAADLLIQEICSMKLSAALEADLRQENSRLEFHQFADTLDRLASNQGDTIKSHILTELDLPASSAP